MIIMHHFMVCHEVITYLTSFQVLNDEDESDDEFGDASKQPDDGDEQEETADQDHDVVSQENMSESPSTPRPATSRKEKAGPSRSTETPVSKKPYKRPRRYSDDMDRKELELLESISAKFDEPEKENREPDDEISSFGQYIVRQLRAINDERVRLTVQNEIQQACFRGRMSSWNPRGAAGGAAHANPLSINNNNQHQSQPREQVPTYDGERLSFTELLGNTY